MSTPAKLPPELLASKPRHLHELADGETTYVVFTSMEVDENGFCYINIDAPLRKKEGVNWIEVRRDAEGYHVVVCDPDTKYKPRALSSHSTRMVPLTSVTVAFP